MTLQNKTAIVTGSTSGIGLGLAEGFAKAGANVVINGFGDADEIEANRARLDGMGAGQVVYDGADMSDPDAIEAFVKSAEDTFGGVDIVVNNAGIQTVEPVETFPKDRWDLIVAINMSSAFHTVRAAMPGMKERGWGRVINIASAHGLTASPFKAAYIAAKHGVVGLTKTTALETAKEPITANAICPGYVLTPIVEKQIPDTMKEYDMTREEVIENVMLTRQPSKEFATVEQMGGTATFLCSDAAAQITGTTISVDGGWTAL